MIATFPVHEALKKSNPLPEKRDALINCSLLNKSAGENRQDIHCLRTSVRSCHMPMEGR